MHTTLWVILAGVVLSVITLGFSTLLFTTESPAFGVPVLNDTGQPTAALDENSPQSSTRQWDSR